VINCVDAVVCENSFVAVFEDVVVFVVVIVDVVIEGVVIVVDGV
jgi:hypothetical protein